MTEQEIRKQNISNIVSFLLFIIGIYNQAALQYGWLHLEFGTVELTGTVNLLYDAVIGIWIYWKNHPITYKARLGQVVINDLKNDKISAGVVNELLEKDS